MMMLDAHRGISTIPCHGFVWYSQKQVLTLWATLKLQTTMANTLEPTKQEKHKLKEIIKKGNLVRYAEWLKEVDTLLHKPYGEDENEFTRCMELTKKSHNFFKEAMNREDFYRNTQLLSGTAILLSEGYIDEADLEPLSPEIRNAVILLAGFYKD